MVRTRSKQKVSYVEVDDVSSISTINDVEDDDYDFDPHSSTTPARITENLETEVTVTQPSSSTHMEDLAKELDELIQSEESRQNNLTKAEEPDTPTDNDESSIPRNEETIEDYLNTNTSSTGRRGKKRKLTNVDSDDEKLLEEAVESSSKKGTKLIDHVPERRTRKRRKKIDTSTLYQRNHDNHIRQKALISQHQNEILARQRLQILHEEESQRDDAVPLSKRLINPMRKEDEEPVYLPVEWAKILKDHQLEGIRFMFKHTLCDEHGVILSHSMGLGKTLQSIMLIRLSQLHFQAKHILILPPKSVVLNWRNEILQWNNRLNLGIDTENICILGEYEMKNRGVPLQKFINRGGILIISQGLFPRLLGMYSKMSPNETLHLSRIATIVEEAIVNSPDLVIVDEVSLMKKTENIFYKSAQVVKTRRRILLSGTPLQNNLLELRAMIDFVRPSFWREEDFHDEFVVPIRAGSIKDSSPESVIAMKWKSFVLVRNLNVIAHRRDQSILRDELPTKYEYVIMVRLSDLQKSLITAFLTQINAQREDFAEDSTGLVKDRKKFRNLLAFTTILHQIINSPALLRYFLIHQQLVQLTDERNWENEPTENLEEDVVGSPIDISSDEEEEDLLEVELGDLLGRRGRKRQRTTPRNVASSTAVPSDGNPSRRQKSEDDEDVGENNVQDSIEKNESDMNINHLYLNRRLELVGKGIELYSWAKPVLSASFKAVDFETAPKIKILYEILEKSLQSNRKVLVFSRYKRTLTLIEMFFRDHPINGIHLIKNASYCRLDGETTTAQRQSLIDTFNDPDFDRHVFLLSTNAGGIGINLPSASVVVLMDIQWNPTNDQQAICRAFRFGQKQNVHVYRLIGARTAEDSIFKRCLNKSWLFRRIIDNELNKRFLNYEQVYDFKLEGSDSLKEDSTISSEYQKDELLTPIVEEYKNTLIQGLYPHEGLFIQEPDDTIVDDSEDTSAGGIALDIGEVGLMNEWQKVRDWISTIIAFTDRQEIVNAIVHIWQKTIEEANEIVDSAEAKLRERRIVNLEDDESQVLPSPTTYTPNRSQGMPPDIRGTPIQVTHYIEENDE